MLTSCDIITEKRPIDTAGFCINEKSTKMSARHIFHIYKFSLDDLIV